MILHVFNPEHDLALASGLSNFTAPHAARQLRADLGYIPALWAGESDYVLVDNVEDAEQRFRRLVHLPFGRFVTSDELGDLELQGVEPWGWDLAIRDYLARHGVSKSLMPDDSGLEVFRQMSSREAASYLLSDLQGERRVGEAFKTEKLEDVIVSLAYGRKLVVKAPWSSSGRGVRFLEGDLKKTDEGWIRNTIASQGYVMVEPQYRKVKDFGMEFCLNEYGEVEYLGLSLFETDNGAYKGSIIADEETKLEMLKPYIPDGQLREVKEMLCYVFSENRDYLPSCFGVDMMVVATDDGDGFLFHPCVEINLRRTMGHVALILGCYLDYQPQLMTIEYNSVYKLKVHRV